MNYSKFPIDGIQILLSALNLLYYTKPNKRVVKEMKAVMPEKNIKLALNLGKLPIIKTDPDKAMQVLRNLIENAMKFSPEGSKVFVSWNE